MRIVLLRSLLFLLACLHTFLFAIFNKGSSELLAALMLGSAILLLISFFAIPKLLQSQNKETKKLSAELNEFFAGIESSGLAKIAVPGNPNEVETTIENLRSLTAGLKEERNRTRSIIDNAADVICVMDVQSKFKSVSPSCKGNWGYSQGDLLGKKLSEFLDESERARSLDAVLGAQNSIEKISFENRFKHKEGYFVDLSWTAHWSARDDGLFCIARDITEQKRAEHALMESEERLRTTISAMPVGIISATKFALIETANSTMEKFIGKSADELIGSPLLNIFYESERARVQARWNEFSKNVESTGSNLETSITQNSGGDPTAENDAPLPVEISFTRFTMHGVPKVLITFSDLRQRKEVERLKREFTSMINHDLRSPIMSVSTLIGLLKMGKYGELLPRGVQLCDLAVSDLTRLIQLINELIDLDKWESGKLTIEPDLLACQDIVEEASASVRTLGELRNIKIVCPETELTCHGDRGRLIQVLINLLSNAIKFSPDDSEIIIAVEELDGKARIAITDSGRGIPEAKIAALFERFEQVNPQDKVEKSGSGLGLSICKVIMDSHPGGAIGCTSEVSKGSTFWISLPLN